MTSPIDGYRPVFLLNLIGLVLLCFCLACGSPTLKDRQSDAPTEIKITSPYHCAYSIAVTNGALSVRSEKIRHQLDSLQSDTVVRGYDTLLTQEDLSRWQHQLRGVVTLASAVDSSRIKDSYTFELYTDGRLLRRRNSSDEEVYTLLDILRPYIIESRIACCDFWITYDRVTR